MKQILFFFDPISPFAHLALEGCSYAVDYRPVLFAGLLKHWGQKGPAEIEPKREWTFRHVAWLAEQQGTALHMPSIHPFNPLALLRLLIAAGSNRYNVEQVMRHVWVDGGDPNDPARLAVLAGGGGRGREGGSAHTDAAIAQGVFGVPTMVLEQRLYWGLDALPMLRSAAC
jgi:2-hydroxychromene-2-carboxylate isomerase